MDIQRHLMARYLIGRGKHSVAQVAEMTGYTRQAIYNIKKAIAEEAERETAGVAPNRDGDR